MLPSIIFSKKNSSGFTLIEVIFAVFIISIALISAYILVQNFVSQAHQSSLRFKAVYLAQEGIEIIRNKRDENWLNGLEWDSGLDAGDWEADYNDADLSTCPSPCDFNNLRFLKIFNGFYGYNGVSETPFKRKIAIAPQGPDKLNVSVEVFWRYQNIIKGPVTIQEILYKWYQ
jgi:prepilin-type N-terminal cleavage/methylation domain-containing protein